MPSNANKVAIAHWHFFSRSIDNRDTPGDYYDTGYLAPGGEGGVHQAYGGLLRNRPLPRPTTISSANPQWRVRDFEDEIRMAQRMGIDAFQINEFGDFSATARTGYMLQAAANVGGGFKVLPSFDCAASSLTDAQIAAYFNAYRSNPNVLRHSDGRLVVSCYRAEAMGATRWQNIISLIGEPVFFLPTLLETGTADDYTSFAGGLSAWRGSNFADMGPAAAMAEMKALCDAEGLEFMAQVMPQDHRPKSQQYREARGSRNAIAGFEFAMANTGRYLCLATWNDYGEGHAWSPATETGYAYADLARYYLSWWKGGAAPAIERDVLYWFYRIERTDAPGTGALQTAPRFAAANGSDRPFEEIELLAFLTAPGRLEISGSSAEVGAGINRLRVPWFEGAPVFRLSRNGSVVIERQGHRPTKATSDYQDLLYRGGVSTR